MTTNAITTLPQWGILGLSGPDAKAFLQGQITCNVEETTLTHSKLGGHCNLKGRLQSLFQVILVEQDEIPFYLLVMPIENLPHAMQQFKKFALFSKVEFTDLTNTMPLIGLCSENAPWSSLEINHCHTETLPMGQYTVRRLIGKSPRFEIICHSRPVFQNLWSTLKKNHDEITPNEWDEYDILSGIPTIYPQTADKILPHHLNLVALGGISFDKGCYLGQEIIARMHYKGKIKKHLYSAFVKSATSPQAGDPIFVEEATESSQPGIIIRTASVQNGYHLLIVLDESDAHSQRLKWNDFPIILDRL